MQHPQPYSPEGLFQQLSHLASGSGWRNQNCVTRSVANGARKATWFLSWSKVWYQQVFPPLAFKLPHYLVRQVEVPEVTCLPNAWIVAWTAVSLESLVLGLFFVVSYTGKEVYNSSSSRMTGLKAEDIPRTKKRYQRGAGAAIPCQTIPSIHVPRCFASCADKLDEPRKL